MTGGKMQKKHKMIISFSAKEREVLSLYASEMGVSRPVALRRIVKRQLREYLRNHNLVSDVPANQLDIFDSVQIDIFNNTSKTI